MSASDSPASGPPRALVPLDPRDRALARLALSRQRLREAMFEPEHDADDTGTAHDAPKSSRWRQWRRWARQSPWLLAGAAALKGWWRAQPWQPVVEASAREVRGSVVPLVRRHPVLSLLAAAGLGAGVVLGRRWWWPVASAHARPLPGRLAQWALGQAANPATHALLASWWLAQRAGQAQDRPTSGQTFPPTGP